ncbi:hypothetical protein A3Q56_03221 [Intoshia linei]|uniref:Uncharacterized protein n=1 Tax=Intoshia linei TaxID=1819745 RepID=A0A177B409_9BILA|nr:hypothetical protein A3Q56_03221 [Intoshia linei]
MHEQNRKSNNSVPKIKKRYSSGRPKIGDSDFEVSKKPSPMIVCSFCLSTLARGKLHSCTQAMRVNNIQVLAESGSLKVGIDGVCLSLLNADEETTFKRQIYSAKKRKDASVNKLLILAIIPDIPKNYSSACGKLRTIGNLIELYSTWKIAEAKKKFAKKFGNVIHPPIFEEDNKKYLT